MKKKTNSNASRTSRTPITRRRWLQSSLAAVALPSLEILRPNNVRAQTTEQNFMVYYLPNGRHPSDWKPTKGNGGLNIPAGSAALRPWANRMAAANDLKNQAALDATPGAAHAKGTSTVLTGTANNMRNITNHISLDQIIANQIGTNSAFKSLQYTAAQTDIGDRCDVDGTACIYTQAVSWAGSGEPLAPNQNLKSAFNQLFGAASGFTPVDPNSAQSAEHMQSILDTLVEDATNLNNALGTSDQQRLEQYFDGLRDVERRLQTSNTMCSTSGFNATTANFEDRIEAFHDLMVLAFQCGQTKVISFMLDWGLTMRTYGFLNAPRPHHATSHWDNEQDDDLRQLKVIEKWQAERLASFLTKMESAQGSFGKSLMDETLILIQPSMGVGRGHDHRRLIPLLIGGNGKIKTDGRVFSSNDLANLGVSVLDAFDVQGNFGRKGARFGDYGTSSIPGLFSDAKP